MDKKKRLSTWIIVIVVALLAGGLIWIKNPLLQLITLERKLTASLIVAVICLFIILLDDVFIRLLQWLTVRQFIQKFKGQNGSESHTVINGQQQNEHITRIKFLRQNIRNIYGRFWRRKIRILLLTGTPADVELLAPGLTTRLWLENDGTLLLWGGDAASTPDGPWLTALRRLRHRPVDALVWVTSAFDHFATLNKKAGETPLSADRMDAIAHRLSARYEALGWQLPLYVWSVHPGSHQPGRVVQPVGCLLPPGAKPADLDAQLASLAEKLTAPGTRQACASPQHTFLLDLENALVTAPGALGHPLSALLNPYRPLPLAGVMFSPPTGDSGREVEHRRGQTWVWDVLLASLPGLPAGLRARRRGLSWRQAVAGTMAAVVMVWGAGMVVSFFANRSLIKDGNTLVRQAVSAQKSPQSRLEALLSLQQLTEKLQRREQRGAPWHTRFGLSQNKALLTALWSRYEDSALPLIRNATAHWLSDQLNALNALPPDSPQRDAMMAPAYVQLKLYLMLARPQKMEPAWFTQTLLKAWPTRAGVKDGYWQGSGPALVHFYAANLPAHPGWALRVDDDLVESSRSILVRQMGVRNGESSLYQTLLNQVARQYPDLRLQDMVGDTDAAMLFTTGEMVPGMFTRQAWDGAVQSAINHVAEARREEMDWVLTDSQAVITSDMSPDALKARLTARYFSDFAGSWLNFLNSLQWVKAATLSDAIDQLTLMADVRQSPLVALMNTLSVQGRTGQSGEGLSDSLVKSAQNLFNKRSQPAIDQSKGAHGPLDAAFGPLLAIIDGTAGGSGNTSLSLQAFLTRVTQARLKLQQVINAADPQAMTRTLAQAVFQGKAIDLTQTRDYGSLVAASLGQEWSGAGNTLFVRPMEQAWQQVLTPAAGSLNAQWKASIVDDWNSVFGGRYPLKAGSSDISLPLMAQYINGDSGRITRFLQTRLSGVLHKEGRHWVADSINAQGLTFNPAFLKAMDTLSHISDVAFVSGPAGMHFELRPGTADGVMQTNLVIDNQKLVYENQVPGWKRFSWPADTEAPGAALSWMSTQSGTRQFADYTGSWGWIRLLDTAQISAYSGLNSSWQVSWKAQDGRKLNYVLRTEAGEGPLVLLKLRNFVLPDTIFMATKGAEVISAN